SFSPWYMPPRSGNANTFSDSSVSRSYSIHSMSAQSLPSSSKMYSVLWSHPYSPISPFHRAGGSGGGSAGGFSFVNVTPSRVSLSASREYLTTPNTKRSSATRSEPSLRSSIRRPPRTAGTRYRRPNDSVRSNQRSPLR